MRPTQSCPPSPVRAAKASVRDPKNMPMDPRMERTSLCLVEEMKTLALHPRCSRVTGAEKETWVASYFSTLPLLCQLVPSYMTSSPSSFFSSSYSPLSCHRGFLALEKRKWDLARVEQSFAVEYQGKCRKSSKNQPFKKVSKVQNASPYVLIGFFELLFLHDLIHRNTLAAHFFKYHKWGAICALNILRTIVAPLGPVSDFAKQSKRYLPVIS